MKIAVVNKKGGSGKTPISGLLALELNAYIFTNEANILESFFKDYMFIAPADELPDLNESIVYDFGGFIDKGILKIIEKCNIVLIPVNNEYDALKKTIETIDEIEKINQNIIIIATKTEGKDYDIIKQNIDSSYPIIELKKSKIFSNFTSTGKRFDELVNENALSKTTYASINKQWNELLLTIQEL
ncbi:MAG: hypothetical protein LBG21_06890 [Campylobacteraceae bacterium]|jgi:cellulose biosynthesis protein BcsQ|nr:hypothetical protein [Campylobacteraceae bacterium]